jgi:hypothetical protein
VQPQPRGEEEPKEPYQINIAKAKEDPQKKVFVKTLFQVKTTHACTTPDTIKL